MVFSLCPEQTILNSVYRKFRVVEHFVVLNVQYIMQNELIALQQFSLSGSDSKLMLPDRTTTKKHQQQLKYAIYSFTQYVCIDFFFSFFPHSHEIQ